MAIVEYWQRGESIDYHNDTGSTIPYNSVVVLGKKIGIAGATIPAGKSGAVHVEGVFSAPTEETFTTGMYVKYDTATKAFVAATDITDAHGWTVCDTENGVAYIKLLP